jgi:hypothetical protein
MNDTTVQIIDCETGKEVIREMNAEELKQYKIDQADSVARKAKIEAEANMKAALLAKLGITADEAKLLLG